MSLHKIGRSAGLHPVAAVATIVLAVLVLMPAAMLRAQEAGEAYRIGRGDRLELRVVLWVEEMRRFENWSAVSGEYTVRHDGTLRLPVGGKIVAQGQTADEVSDEIARAIQAQIGSVEDPGVTLEVIGYRPFFVLGDVDQPGAFPADPELTVLQAFALAGGQRRTAAAYGDGLAAMRDGGSLRQTLIDIARAQVRMARLRAEILGNEAIDVPEELAHPEGEDALSAAIAEETAVFESRATALSLEVANLNELKVLLTTEIASLEEKFERLGTQVGLARDALERVERLQVSGLVRANQAVDAQRQLFDLESQELDLQTAIFRSQQRMKEADRDLVALRTQRVTDATTELLRVAGELEQMEARQQTLRSLIAESGTLTPESMGQVAETTFHLTPAGGTARDETVVGPEQRIAPGDTLRVVRRLAEDREAE